MFLGNASLFTKCLFTIFVPLNPPHPNQQSDGFPLEFPLRGPQTELRTCSQNYEQTLPKLRTNRIMNKRVFLRFVRGPRMGVGSVVVASAFLGAPDFQSRGPRALVLKGF